MINDTLLINVLHVNLNRLTRSKEMPFGSRKMYSCLGRPVSGFFRSIYSGLLFMSGGIHTQVAGLHLANLLFTR